MTRKRPISEHIAYLWARATRQGHQQLDEEFRGEGVPVEHWRILKLCDEKNARAMPSGSINFGKRLPITDNSSAKRKRSSGRSISGVDSFRWGV